MQKSKFNPTTTTKQKIIDPNEKIEKQIYDSITTTQQAINMAIAENRVVRFKSSASNKEIKRTVDDLRGCSMRKPDKDSHEVAIIPPGIEDFCFEEEVDESLVVVPRPRIYRPDGSIV